MYRLVATLSFMARSQLVTAWWSNPTRLSRELCLRASRLKEIQREWSIELQLANALPALAVLESHKGNYDEG
jgi:hypothetical protein